MFEIVDEGAGTSSYHAEYDGCPLASTSCSVPTWISVLSPTVQLESTQPPPIPTQSADDSDCPAVCWASAGTVHSPANEWNCLPLCSIVPRF